MIHIMENKNINENKTGGKVATATKIKPIVKRVDIKIAAAVIVALANWA